MFRFDFGVLIQEVYNLLAFWVLRTDDVSLITILRMRIGYIPWCASEYGAFCRMVYDTPHGRLAR